MHSCQFQNYTNTVANGMISSIYAYANNAHLSSGCLLFQKLYSTLAFLRMANDNDIQLNLIGKSGSGVDDGLPVAAI
jgi:K+-transporting ATPase c subunit